MTTQPRVLQIQKTEMLSQDKQFLEARRQHVLNCDRYFYDDNLTPSTISKI